MEIDKRSSTCENEVKIKYNSAMAMRIFLVTFALAVVVLNTIYGFIMPHSDVNCLLDKSFELTAGINKYLQDNIQARHILIAFSSFCVDFVIICMSIHWSLYGRSWRLITAIGFFYLLRGTIQNIFQMKYPEGYLWEYPGFPSLTISYLKTNDFFFSGHVGFPIIIAMECYNLGKKYMMTFCFFTCFVEAFTMIVTRGHYCIDVVTGIIVSHYVYLMVERFAYLIDDSCIGMKDIKEDVITNKDDDLEKGFIPVEFAKEITNEPTNK